ncbi:MAG: acid phosphatase [Gammaproteobacteria bacterium]|nr:acid phosphatase [Gammaproteobacteria bacterium]MCH9763329.1 acid phosphatase [Gammaproteobacteria bacterium]
MDKRILPHTFFVVTTLLCVGTKSFAEPTNIGTLRTELKSYHDTGAYNKELESVAEKAELYIDARAKTNAQMATPSKLAIVLDIDDTALSNYQYIIQRNFCEDQQKIIASIQHGNAPAIKPILKLYNDARNEKVAVFFITGRAVKLQKATEKNLKSVGYTTWNGIFFRPKEDTNQSAVPYKTQARAVIEKQGYKIIASIGDQNSDLSGGHAEKTFKLPNPFYNLK